MDTKGKQNKANYDQLLAQYNIKEIDLSRKVEWIKSNPGAPSMANLQDTAKELLNSNKTKFVSISESEKK